MPEPYEEPFGRRTRIVGPESDMQIEIEIGMMGFSAEDIEIKKQGWCYLPLGPRDSTKWQGRKYVRVKMTALENVRANRDIIVATVQGQIKEHTPVELSYDKHPQGNGNYQRVGEDFPLPVTMGSRSISWKALTKTDADATSIITPVDAGNKIRVAFLIISNNQATVVDVGIGKSSSLAADGDFLLRLYIPADGGTVSLNLLDAGIEGDVGGAIYAYCAAAYANGVRFNLGYREVA